MSEAREAAVRLNATIHEENWTLRQLMIHWFDVEGSIQPFDVEHLTKYYETDQSEYDTDIETAYSILCDLDALVRGQARDALTDLALTHSLCPIHFWDYAICFDNEPETCSQVRIIHPSHDT